jgi:hypothetical protein
MYWLQTDRRSFVENGQPLQSWCCHKDYHNELYKMQATDDFSKEAQGNNGAGWRTISATAVKGDNDR